MPPDQAPSRGARLRGLSRSLVLAEITTSGAVTQAELVQRTNLSRATVASIVKELLAGGHITAAAEADHSGRGRPAARFELARTTQHVAGVDFGHSHLAVAIADLTGTIIAQQREELDVHVSAAPALDRATAVFEDLVTQAQLSSRPANVVIGLPGPVALEQPGPFSLDSRRICAGTVLASWVGLDPAAELSQRIDLPVVAENDANLGAIGEQRFGAGIGHDNVVYVKVSSGIGAGLVLGGRLYRGSRGAAGEIGHVQIREDGALCRCGSRGCLETVSSADAALELLSRMHQRPVDIDELLAFVAARDHGALRLLTDMGSAIGRVLATVAANLEPSLIIVGGRVATPALLDGLRSAIAQRTQPYVTSGMEFAVGELGESAGLLGAIALAISRTIQPGLPQHPLVS